MSHPLEPELRGILPRPVHRRPGHGRLFGKSHLTTLPHTVIGLGFIVVYVFWGLFLSLGTQLDGRVTSVEGAYGKRGRYWRVSYDYPLDGGVDSGTGSFSVDPKLSVGSPIRVQTFGLGPIRHTTPVEAIPYLALLAFLVMGLVWNGIVVMIQWSITVRPLQWRALVRSGTAAAGTVLGVRWVGKERHPWCRYAFSAGPGQRLEAEMYIRPEDDQRFAAGAPVTVLFDPQRPKRSVVYLLAPWEVGPAAKVG